MSGQLRETGTVLELPTEDDGNVYVMQPIGRSDAVRLNVTDRYRAEVEGEPVQAEVILTMDDMLRLSQWLIGKVREMQTH